MDRALADYLRLLRASNVPVSMTEAVDAVRAVDLVGYDDRAVLKSALASVLAKSREEKNIHEQCFELFFASAGPEKPIARGGEPSRSNGAEEGLGAHEGEGADAAGSGGERALTSLLALAQGDDRGGQMLALARAGREVGVDQIRFASQTAYYARRMLEVLGVEALEARLLDRLEAQTPEARAEADALIEARSALTKRAKSFVNSRFEIFGRPQTELFMNEIMQQRSLGALGPGDMERMKPIVAKMAKRLAVKHARRRRRRDTGRLDVRRTLHANAGYGGIPFDVVFKMRRKDRPKIVAVCDVSGSVARYVRFLLLLLYTLREKVADLETYAFSARLMDVSGALETLSFEAAMNKIIVEVGSGGTDYGQALVDLDSQFSDAIDRRTTLLVLGDGRSNYADPRTDIFRRFADQAKRVIWLCPEPQSSWGSGDSCLFDYEPFCNRLAYCATASDLERSIDEILLAYD